MMDFQSIVILIGLILVLVWIFNRKKTSKDNYCFDCKRPVIVKRRIGFFSVLASILTLGLWCVFVIPFYKGRCFICGGDNVGEGDSVMMEERRLKEVRKQEEALDELVRQRRTIAR
ncbi:MAG: hypothetical protein QNI91_18470 [Arenicellales bacterium]|nr:hypothetical protein [Arenicellales bacterium]